MPPLSPLRLDDSIPLTTPTDLTTAPDDPTPSTETPDNTPPGPLKPDIFPHVIAQLDLDLDLDTLLVCQRVSETGWNLVTKRLYREVTVRDWSKFLRMPEGYDLPTIIRDSRQNSMNIDDAPMYRAHLISFLRRVEAFAHIEFMTVHVLLDRDSSCLFGALGVMAKLAMGKFSITEAVTAIRNNTAPATKCFPRLRKLRITECAMILGGPLPNLDSADLFKETSLSQICVHLPRLHIGESSSQHDNMSRVDEIQHTLYYLLYGLRTGHQVDIFLHQPQDFREYKLWTLLSTIATKHAHHHIIFQQPTAADTLTAVALEPFERAEPYAKLLVLAKKAEAASSDETGGISQEDSSVEPETGATERAGAMGAISLVSNDQTQTERHDPGPALSWTISGELPISDHFSDTVTATGILDQIIVAMEHDYNLMVTDGLISGGDTTRDFARVVTKEEIGIKCLRFRLPGHEEVCPVCGCS